MEVLDEEDTGINTDTAAVENHCPCSCTIPDLDERGYCPHLIGFTNDKKKFEPLYPIMTKPTEEHPEGEPTGRFRVSGKKKDVQEVLKTDILVNPSSRQIQGGIQRLAYRWVSWRVYRKEPKKAK